MAISALCKFYQDFILVMERLMVSEPADREIRRLFDWKYQLIQDMREEDNKRYQEFLNQKKQTRIESGFEISEDDLNPALFPFQKYCVRRALAAGKFALFEDCGLGKTIQQLEWA